MLGTTSQTNNFTPGSQWKYDGKLIHFLANEYDGYKLIGRFFVEEVSTAPTGKQPIEITDPDTGAKRLFMAKGLGVKVSKDKTVKIVGKGAKTLKMAVVRQIKEKLGAQGLNINEPGANMWNNLQKFFNQLSPPFVCPFVCPFALFCA